MSRGVGITVDVSGESTPACDALFASRTEVGGWLIGDTFQVPAVTVDRIEHMCIDEADVYVPTETWTREDGASCECSLDYEEVCEMQ